MTSFFGGDPAVSHWTLTIPFNYRLTGEAKREAVKQRDDTRAKLKTAGYKERYFQFRNDDAKGKEAARRLAETEKALWEPIAVLDIHEGCFL